MRLSQDPQGRRAAIVVATLALACAPVASLAQVLFSDTFDTAFNNASPSSRYDVFSFDNSVSTSTVTAGTGTNDVGMQGGFNYGAYTYRHISSNEIDYVNEFIPKAPRTTDATSTGLRLDANSTSTGGTGTAIINLLPKVSEFTGGVLPSGNFKLTVDVWVNYNGPATGGTGSTEYAVLGINQQNPGPANGLAGPVITNPAVQQHGVAFAVDGETGSGTDYRVYTDNSRLGDYDSSTGYVAQVQPGGISANNGEQNPYYNTLMPAPEFESKGGVGKHWVTMEVKYVDGLTYYSLNPNTSGSSMTLIATHTDRTSPGGNVALGYADLNSGVAGLETNVPPPNQDASFVLFDNLVVEGLGAPAAQPAWTGGAGGSWTGGTWTVGTPNSNTSVATFGAGAAGGTVTVGSLVTVREIVFDNSGMTISGAGPLKMDSPGASGGDMSVFTVKQGVHTVSAPLQINRNVLVHTEAANSSLTLTQPIADSTYEWTKSGAGTLTMPASKNGGITVLGGTVKIAPGSGTLSVDNFLIVGSLAAQRGSIDIDNNRMVYHYDPLVTSGTPAAAAAYFNLRDSIGGAYHGGLWNSPGLTSSVVINDSNKIKGLGYWDASVLTGVTAGNTTTWFGQTVDTNTFLIAVTYLGDINGDGKVDGDDYALLDRGRTKPVPVNGSGVQQARAKWQDGDLNYDGFITVADYAIIDKTFGILHPGGLTPDFLAAREAEFGADYVSELVASVPEPTSLGLFAIAGAGLIARRRRA